MTFEVSPVSSGAGDRGEVSGQIPLAIEATGLIKSFGETRAVDGVDLAVRSGSVYGVLGPNGRSGESQ
jgi:ABC-type sugar transport system ATPase subunit